MIITYYGNLCVKAQIGDTSVAFNPPLRNDGRTPRFSSNVALFSTKEKDQNFSNSAGNPNDFFIADGPGEYEIGGIFIRGIGVEQVVDGIKKMNTVYSVLFDEINLCHLGAVNVSELKPEVMEALGSIDILFVPITGEPLATPSTASKLTTALEPRIIIPLQATDKGISTDSLKLFLKEEGSEGITAIDKLTIKKKEIEGKEEEIIVLTPIS
ncbi:MAG: MBL fold metallo-hydrolase [bacterium]